MALELFRFRQVYSLHFAYFYLAKFSVSILPSDSTRFNSTFRLVFRSRQSQLSRQVFNFAKFTKGKACWRNVESWRNEEIGGIYIIGEIESSLLTDINGDNIAQIGLGLNGDATTYSRCSLTFRNGFYILG